MDKIRTQSLVQTGKEKACEVSFAQEEVSNLCL